MKKIFLAMLASSVIGMSAGSYAVPVNQNSLANHVVSVQQAKNLADDSLVQLKGHINRSLGDEKYEFQDQTGTIEVEIDHELWHGKALDSKQTVTLIGELDIDYKPLKKVEIDVKEVRF